jgi:hypothetical protein
MRNDSFRMAKGFVSFSRLGPSSTPETQQPSPSPALAVVAAQGKKELSQILGRAQRLDARRDLGVTAAKSCAKEQLSS